MTKKRAEKEFAALMKRYDIWCHKWGDVRICEVCEKRLVYQTRTQDDDPREIKESIVDYEIIIPEGWHNPDVYPTRLGWVEVKEVKESFPFSAIDPKQRQFLTSWSNRGVACWLHLQMGEGNVLKGERFAWLIPWNSFAILEEKISSTQKSIPLVSTVRLPRNVHDLLHQFALLWRDGGWEIPINHDFTFVYPQFISHIPLYDKD